MIALIASLVLLFLVSGFPLSVLSLFLALYVPSSQRYLITFSSFLTLLFCFSLILVSRPPHLLHTSPYPISAIQPRTSLMHHSSILLLQRHTPPRYAAQCVSSTSTYPRTLNSSSHHDTRSSILSHSPQLISHINSIYHTHVYGMLPTSYC